MQSKESTPGWFAAPEYKQRGRQLAAPPKIQSEYRNQAAVEIVAFRFLRHPRNPRPPRPEARRGSAAGRGTSEAVADIEALSIARKANSLKSNQP